MLSSTVIGDHRPALQANVGSTGAGALFVRWQRHGDPSAREELVRRFLPLARKLARRYSGSREPFDDLLQVASLGLVKAIDRFDPARGHAFSSFAVPTIIGELKRYFRDSGWSAHVPRGAQELALKVQDAQERLAARTGRAPSVNELAEYMELDIEQVVDALETAGAHHATSLDAPIDDEDGDSSTLADALGATDDGFELVEATATIGAAARELTERERHVVALRFLEDKTQTEIAGQVGVSQMQVSRILRRALSRLTELTGEAIADAAPTRRPPRRRAEGPAAA
jgi:RNA polymerase sigma-B factor